MQLPSLNLQVKHEKHHAHHKLIDGTKQNNLMMAMETRITHSSHNLQTKLKKGNTVNVLKKRKGKTIKLMNLVVNIKKGSSLRASAGKHLTDSLTRD